jgi:hypothetical protein
MHTKTFFFDRSVSITTQSGVQLRYPNDLTITI